MVETPWFLQSRHRLEAVGMLLRVFESPRWDGAHAVLRLGTAGRMAMDRKS